MDLQCRDIKRQLSERFCLGPLTHRFVQGSTTAILGHNGAGKSTFFRLVSGLDEACGGEMLWGNERIHQKNHHYKRSIGYLAQPLEMPLWVSGGDLLSYVSALKKNTDKADLASLMDLFGVTEYQHKALASCSYGMRKRVALVMSLLGDPGLLILDEPLSGLDITHIGSLRHILQKRKQRGQCTLLSTHILSFACEEACHVLLMNSGTWQEVKGWGSWDRKQQEDTLKTFFDS
ncbi:MAG: ABC transporter ATP-binding protein [Proteobacteria bacterium]|nr:ABC transporter ATP-binding protein [Pseudomonadota bacterium]